MSEENPKIYTHTRDNVVRKGTIRLELGKESIEIIGTEAQARKIHALVEASITQAFWAGCVGGSVFTLIMTWVWS